MKSFSGAIRHTGRGRVNRMEWPGVNWSENKKVAVPKFGRELGRVLNFNQS